MPYPITEQNGRYCVNGKCYDARADAEAYQRALYANAPDVQKSLGNTGAMIAFYPSASVASLLFGQTAGGLPVGGRVQTPDDMHITLLYLGDAAAVADQETALSAVLESYAARREPIDVLLNGLARFYTLEDDETNPVVVTVDSPALPDLRQELLSLVRSIGVEPVLNHGFIPHITIAYVPWDGPTPTVNFQPLVDSFLKLSLVLGDKRIDFPFRATQQPQAMQVIKQANGIYRWSSTSTNNILDRDGETLSLKSIQADVARTRMFGDDDGCTYFYHIPYSLGGPPDYRAVVDGMLVESGEFYDEPVAKTIAEYAIAHPEGLDGSGWGTSIGFMGVPDLTGTYHSVLIKERSVLPLSKAANAYTSFGVRNKMALTADQQKALDLVLGDPALVGVVKAALGAQDQSKMADGQGVIRKAARPSVDGTTPAVTPAAPAVPVFKKAGDYSATPQDKMGFGTVTKADAGEDPKEEATETTDEETAEEAGKTKAAAAPVQTPPPPAQPAAPAIEQTKALGLSDDDLKGIAQYVNDTVQKAVTDAVTKLQADIQQVQKTFSLQTQAKMLNEIPVTTLDRLKAFGATPAAAVPKTIPAVGVDGSLVEIPNPAYVEKGQNLPAAPDDPAIALMSVLGFGPAQQ